jgi:hypothetical protein
VLFSTSILKTPQITVYTAVSLTCLLNDSEEQSLSKGHKNSRKFETNDPESTWN